MWTRSTQFQIIDTPDGQLLEGVMVNVNGSEVVTVRLPATEAFQDGAYGAARAVYKALIVAAGEELAREVSQNVFREESVRNWFYEMNDELTQTLS